MPLHVDIRINHQLITQVHIGRIEGSTDPDSVNTYRAVATDPHAAVDFWADNSIEFTHRYGDGALSCAQKAITLIEQTHPRGLEAKN